MEVVGGYQRIVEAATHCHRLMNIVRESAARDSCGGGRPRSVASTPVGDQADVSMVGPAPGGDQLVEGMAPYMEEDIARHVTNGMRCD